MSQVQPLKKPPGFRDPTIPIQRPPYQLPRKNVLPPSFYQEKKRSTRSCSCSCRCCSCCCCLLIFLFLLLILAAAVGVLYLWFNPKLPVFHLRSLEFTRFNVTETQDDGAKLNARSSVGVELKNPNSELKIVYGETRVELKGENEVKFGEGRVSGFVQEKKSVKVLKFVMNSSKDQILYGDSVGKVMRNGFKNKNLRVFADVTASIGIGYNGWKSLKIGVRVSCGGLRLKMIENGVTPKCGITLFNWFHLN